MSEYELPQQVPDISIKTRQLSAGARHTIILDELSDLWQAGRTESGETLCKFTRLEFNYKFQRVACGWDVTAGITKDNRLFVWGNNAANQLGLPEKGIIKQPKELHLPDNAIPIEVKFGLKFIVVRTSSHKLLIAGLLRPLLKAQTAQFSIKKHNALEWLQVDDVMQFACGQSHISFIGSDGRVIDSIGECEGQDTFSKFL